MSDELRSVLIGTSALGAVLLAALALTLRRPMPAHDPAAREKLLRLFLLGVALQCLHFTEEFVTDFHVRYPELLGLTPWAPEFFVTFNLAWIAIWVASSVGARAGFALAYLPIWFFALGMSLNGIAHPLLALRANGYFPGLFTSPAVGILGFVLLHRLLRASRRQI